MANGEEKQLTCADAYGKMCLKIRWNARHLEHGKIHIEGDLQVVNGEITQCDIKIEPTERFRANGK